MIFSAGKISQSPQKIWFQVKIDTLMKTLLYR